MSFIATEDVVITGVSGRYPRSDNVEEFSKNLYNGILMSTADDGRWPVRVFGTPVFSGKIKSIDRFDNEFFGISSQTSNYLDHQMRLLLEVTYETIIDSGHDPEELRGSSTAFYYGSCFYETPTALGEKVETLPAHLECVESMIPFHFDLRGPVCHIDTACASSMCTFHEAYKLLKFGKYENALVAGFNVPVRIGVSLQFLEMQMISKEGLSKSMDKSADGFGRAEAVVVIFLQKAKNARRIYARVVNSKSNTDGYKVEGINFPSRKLQSQLMKELYAETKLNPKDLGYVEAHVTGTQAGDPVELGAIYDVCCDKSKLRSQPLLVGALKSCMGHSEGASGLCAITKAILILQNKSIPPNQLFVSPNPNIEGLMNGSLVPVITTTPFMGSYIPLNCFGFGGSNIHTLIQRVDSMKASGKGGALGTRLITCCGRSPEAVNYMLDKIIENIKLVNVEFLHLLNKISNQRRMHVRGASLISFNYSKQIHRSILQNISGNPRKIALFLTGHQSDTKTLSECFLQLPAIKEALNELISFFERHKISINGLIRKDGAFGSEADKFLHNACVQFLLLDTLKRVGVKTEAVFAESWGKLLEAYWTGALENSELFSLLLCIHSMYDSLKDSENKLAFETFKQNAIEKLKVLLNDKYVTVTSVLENLRLKYWFDDHESDIKQLPQTLLNNHSEYEMILEIGTKPKEVPTTFTNCYQIGAQDCNQNLFDSTDLLRILGEIYLSGQNIHIEELYDKDEQQPAPCETLTISSMLKWNHEAKHALYLFPEYQNPFRSTGQFPYRCDIKTSEDWFFQNHKIDGRILFPATGYLFLAWYVATRFYSLKASKTTTEFRDVTFQKAVLLSNKGEHFDTRYLPWNGSFAITHSGQVACKGTIILNSKLPNHVFPEESTCDAIELTLSQEDIYNELRIRGYDYGYYFQNLLEATTDGRKGLLAWKNSQVNVMAIGSMLEIVETEQFIFLRNWGCFVDSALQLSLLAHQDARVLLVPTKIEKLVCDPMALEEALRTAAKRDISNDKDKPEVVPVVPVRFDKELNVIATPGLYAKGLQATYISRKPQLPTLEKYVFLPYEEARATDDGTKKYLQKYLEKCRKLAAKFSAVEFGQSIDELESTKFDDSSDQHSLYKYLKEKLEATAAGKEMVSPDFDRLNKDLLIGSGYELCRKPRFLKQMLESAIYPAICRLQNKAINITEVNLGPNPYCPDIISIIDDITMNANNINYTLISKDSKTTAVPKTVTNVRWNGSKDTIQSLSQISNQDLLVWVVTWRNLEPDVLLSTAAAKLSKGSYLLLVFEDDNEPSPKDEFSNILETELRSKQYILDELRAAAKDQKWKYIYTKKLNAEILPHTAVLLQHSDDSKSKVDDVWIQVSDEDYEWIEPLKNHLQGEDDQRIILTSSNTMNGGAIIGFVKSIGLEQGGHRVRCLVNVPGSKKLIDISNDRKEVKQVLEKDLIFNLFSEGIWGSFVHLPMPSDLKSDESIQTESEFAYIKSLTPGDLSSLAWVQDKHESLKQIDLISKEKIVDVYYSALNFKDVMLATGRLPPEALSMGLKSVLKSDSLLGLEFAGRDGNGKRIMGLCQSKGLATRLVLTADDFVFEIPDKWTFEEASTIPVVYSTCYYGMLVRGRLQPKESILIHAGSGGIGIAAISIALSMNCKVYTTVGSPEKREFIKKEFPILTDDQIFNSRSTKFEEDILMATNGKGVDMVLNSLAEEKLQASVRCLARSGRFIEIGKYDSVMDNKLIFEPFYADQCISFHGVHMDACFGYNDERSKRRFAKERQQIRNLVEDGIKNGIVRPLTKTIFDVKNVEKAFRYMASGKHIGKVVIELQKPLKEDESCNVRKVEAFRVTNFYGDKSYIIIGGFGGLGLELASWMVFKGARKVILNSRKGPVNSYHYMSLKRLRSAGVEVIVSKHDTSNLKEAANLIEAANKLGPVGGVFNCALVLSDGPFNEQTSETFLKVCAPKTKITKNLDQLTRELCPKLDHFVFFSSIASGKGNSNQTNYGFANSLAESICIARRSDGLPGLAIQWGVIGDVGYVQRVTKLGNAIIRGLTSQRLFSCIETLDRLMQSPNAIVLSMVKAVSSVDSSDKKSLISVLAHILGVQDINKVDPNTTLGELGMDSLMAVEIRQVLERDHDIVLTVKEVRELKVSDVRKLQEHKGKTMSNSKNDEARSNTEGLTMCVPKDATTNLNSCIEGKPIFALGPLDGDFESLKILAGNFNRPFIALNWTPDLLEDNETNKVVLRFIHLMKTLDNSEAFQMVAHSFGYILALQIADYISSRRMGKIDKLVSLDFEAGQLKQEFKSIIGYESVEDVTGKASVHFLAEKVSKLTSNEFETVFSDLKSIQDHHEREKRVIQILKDSRLEEEVITTVIQGSKLFVQKVTALEKFEEIESKTFETKDSETLHIKRSNEAGSNQNSDSDKVNQKMMFVTGTREKFIEENIKLLTSKIEQFFGGKEEDFNKTLINSLKIQHGYSN